MAIREVRAAGLEALALATDVLQRARLSDPTAGLWEAADLQWWWRKPRSSDTVEQRFWIDDDGPVAAVVVTEWPKHWNCDPIVVCNRSEPSRASVWASALDMIDELSVPRVEVLADDDDAEMLELLADARFAATGERDGTTWMTAGERPPVPELPEGFRLVDRVERAEGAHPMLARNGSDVEQRLRQTSLYEPALDLAIVAANGDVAGYALFWNDAVTGGGVLEPMRVEDGYQRRGLARALLANGLERLAACGARRLKVSYTADAARDLYVGAGFHITTTAETYARQRDG